jgi:hypothetical protein
LAADGNSCHTPDPILQLLEAAYVTDIASPALIPQYVKAGFRESDYVGGNLPEQQCVMLDNGVPLPRSALAEVRRWRGSLLVGSNLAQV